jgi:hypothetical protein
MNDPTARRAGLRPCTLVYLALVALTLATFAAGQLRLGGLGLSLGVLGVALLKGQLVADHFMGLKGIRGPWRWAVAIWLLLAGGLVALAFALTGPAVPPV